MTEGAELEVYGVKGSPFVRKVQVLLAEKGVDFELTAVNIFPAPAWFAAINPAKRIPVLRDRSIGAEGATGTVPDSSAICAHLDLKQLLYKFHMPFFMFPSGSVFQASYVPLDGAAAHRR